MRARIALVGLGKQNTSDHLAAITTSDKAVLVAVCDLNEAAAKEWGKKLHVPYFTSVDNMINTCDVDAAVVAVPHFAYMPIITSLAKNGVHILKEKPLAMNFDEATDIAAIADQYQINLTVAVQRKFNKIYQKYLEYAPRLGHIFSISGHYSLNIDKLDGDWRRSRELAGGGATLDMGYHIIDLINWYFGLPDKIYAELGFHNRSEQAYDVEDTAKIQFSYTNGNVRTLGDLTLSRIYPTRDEVLYIYGTKGTVVVRKNSIELQGKDGSIIEQFDAVTKGDDVTAQFEAFVTSLEDTSCRGNYQEHLKNMAFIDAIYQSDLLSRVIVPSHDNRYTVPIITKEEAPYGN